MEATKVSSIIEQTNLGKRISSKTFTKLKCKNCHKPMTLEEAERGLCNKCMAPILKARQDGRLKEIKEKIRELENLKGNYQSIKSDNLLLLKDLKAHKYDIIVAEYQKDTEKVKELQDKMEAIYNKYRENVKKRNEG